MCELLSKQYVSAYSAPRNIVDQVPEVPKDITEQGLPITNFDITEEDFTAAIK